MDGFTKMEHHAERHDTGLWLRDIILGGQDGLVNVLGIILGISAAGGQQHIIIAASLAATFAEAVSMGAVAYTSTMADKKHYENEEARERFEIEKFPEHETQEVYEIYRAKGFSGKLLDQIVETITSNKEVWLKNMMSEELGLQINKKQIIYSSLIVGVTTVIGSLIPLVPYFFLIKSEALVFSLVLSGVVLFGVGIYESKNGWSGRLKSGLQMLLIGLGAALIGFLVGRVFNVG